jgi:hypothetical protein
VGSWFLDKVLPGLIDAIPFVLVVGFGLQRHKKVLDQANDKANDKQTAELVRKLGDRE